MTFAERNAELCKLYTDGQTIAALSTHYKISRQRVRQILRAASVWKKPATRTAFLGIDVTQETKDNLKAEADKQQKSVSKLASDALDTMFKGEQG